MAKRYHIVKNNFGEWSGKKEGSSRASVTARTQREAYEKTIPLATNAKTEIVIHGVNGKIRNSNSFGNDPCPPKDKKH